MSDGRAEQPTAVRRWLLCVWALVLAMVVVGGITRLTGSGLSIVEWRPVTGVLPPLDDAAWEALFAQYRRTPQFRLVNAGMTLAGFKQIFFWEYVHRLLGRVVGLFVVGPLIWFAWRRALTGRLLRQVLLVLALGAAQGLLGWLMVQSGLVQEPRVSHYRLAAHLLLAFVTGGITLWVALGVGSARGPLVERAGAAWALGLLALVLVQCVWGAFMAGTHAGHYVATFPDMNGRYAPGPFFTGASIALDAVSSPLAIHYVHRALAFALLAYALALPLLVRHLSASPAVRSAAWLVAAAAFVQLNVGAITVLSRIAIPWAVLHQALAYGLLSALVLLLHRLSCAPPVR